MPQVNRWFRFGWQGVGLDVPADWDLTRFDGTRAKGYARLADPDVVRIELRWDRPKRSAGFEAVADRAFQRLAKQGDVDVERRTGLAELEGKDTETFTCRPAKGKGSSSYNMISVCRECGRSVMVRVLFQPGENIKAIVRRVLGSLQDHSYDGADAWGAHGMQFAVPETMELDKGLIYPGSVDFRFLSGKDRLGAGRVALASIILKNTTLEDWFRSFARKRFKKIRYESEEAEIRGHPGLELRGRLKGIGALVPRLVRRQRFLCRLWHCDVSDKLFYFAVLARARNFDSFAAYSQRFVCH